MSWCAPSPSRAPPMKWPNNSPPTTVCCHTSSCTHPMCHRSIKRRAKTRSARWCKRSRGPTRDPGSRTIVHKIAACKETTMNRTVHKLCAWSGVLLLIIMAVGFILMAGFIPTRSPSQSATETAQFIIEHRTRIRWGMILTMFSAALLQPFYTEITLQMRRIEGRYPALALIQFGLGTLLVLEFIYLIFFWQTATYRVERSPELIQLLNDMAWIPFVGLSSTVVLGVAVFGIAIL